MVLDRLPITPNGKIDRNALPEPGPDLSESLFEAPRTDTEERLLKVWKRILTSDDIGIHNNYFDLGGDSILSIQIVARARAEGLVINPGDLFRHPTVAELSRVAQSQSQIAILFPPWEPLFSIYFIQCLTTASGSTIQGRQQLLKRIV